MLIFFLICLGCTVLVGSVNAILRIKNQQNKIWGYISLTLVLLGGTLSFYIFQQNGKKSGETIQRLESTIENLNNLQRYGHVSNLGMYGGENMMGPGLYTTDPLYNALSGTYRIENNAFKFNCGQEYEDRYKAIIEQYPDFPFTYYALADCKKQRNEEDWRAYATKAVEILKWTTQIGGHKAEHGQALSQMLSDLAQ